MRECEVWFWPIVATPFGGEVVEMREAKGERGFGGFEVMGRGFGEVCFGGGGERWTFWVLLWGAVEACVVVVLEMR